ncbi:MAG: septum formation initiator family protein [Actinomycetia bacterium]|nr:septum formation initiator family protein [Actinomycetes bacterium]
MSSGGHKTSAIPRPKAGSRTRTHGVKPTGAKSSGSRSTGAKASGRAGSRPPAKRQGKSAPRQAPSNSKSKSSRKAPRAGTSRNDDSRFADFTRPIPVEKQLVRGGGKRRIIGIGAGVITAAFVAALFVLPVQAWLRQQDDLDHKDDQLAALQDANADLANEVQQLQTPEGIEQAAREEIGYVQQGEIRYTMLPAPEAPATLPSGWPYDTIAKIVAVRSADAAKP